MVRFIAFAVLAVIIELFLLMAAKNKSEPVEKDPMALPYKAHKVNEPSFNYIPGRQTYDDKSKRFVIDWKYEWDYQGKNHSMMFCDNPNSQYEHYMAVFPEEIDITIHKETGNYYVSKEQRAASRESLWTLLVSMVLSWVITGLIFK